jgi:hypothetical protein
MDMCRILFLLCLTSPFRVFSPYRVVRGTPKEDIMVVFEPNSSELCVGKFEVEHAVCQELSLSSVAVSLKATVFWLLKQSERFT